MSADTCHPSGTYCRHVAHGRVLAVLVLIASACGTGPRSYTRHAYFKGARVAADTLLLHRETTYAWSTPDKRWGFDIETEGKGGIVRVDHRYFALSLATGGCREVTADVFAKAGGDSTPAEQATPYLPPPPFEVLGKSLRNGFPGVVVRVAGYDWEYSRRTRTRWTFPAPAVSQPAWATPVPLPSEGWHSMDELGEGSLRYLAVGVVDQKLFVRRRWATGQQEDTEVGPVTGPVVWFEGTLVVAGDDWVRDLSARTVLTIPRGKVEVIAVELLTREYLLRIQPSEGPAIWKALSSTVLDSTLLDFLPPTGHVVAAHGDRQVRLESAARTAWLYGRTVGWRAVSFDACYRIAPTWSDEVEHVGRP